MISIIIPVYNHQKELKKCLASILKQTYQVFEVIVVDDGSQPPLQQSITRFYLSKFQCRVFRIEHAGANGARNFGFQKSTGDYVLFCDADVKMKPGMLEKMMRALQAHPESSYAYSSFYFGWKRFTLWPFDPEKLKVMNYIHTTSLIQREAFPVFSAQGGPASGWDESIRRFQDWDLWLTMLEKGSTGVWVPEVLFSVKPGGTMSRWVPRGLYPLAQKLGLTLRRVKEYERARDAVLRKHALL